jgi:hypothetical protein
MRPPFTTLVTRFTEIIFSRKPSLRSSDPMLRCQFRHWLFLELESALAGGFGQRLSRGRDS